MNKDLAYNFLMVQEDRSSTNIGWSFEGPDGLKVPHLSGWSTRFGDMVNALERALIFWKCSVVMNLELALGPTYSTCNFASSRHTVGKMPLCPPAPPAPPAPLFLAIKKPVCCAEHRCKRLYLPNIEDHFILRVCVPVAFEI